MDHADFLQLCRDTCTALNYPDPEALASRHQISLDGIDIGLFFDEFDAADRLICYIDIGPLPDIGREELLERLLAINLLTGTKTAGVYGLDPDRDHVLFIQHFLYPDMMSGQTLAGILQGYSQHAKAAQRTFLDAFNNAPLSDLLVRSFESPRSSLV